MRYEGHRISVHFSAVDPNSYPVVRIDVCLEASRIHMKDEEGTKGQRPCDGQHFSEFTVVKNQWNASIVLRECGNRETQLGSVKLGPGVDTCVLAQGEHCSTEYIKLSHPFYSLDGFL